MTQVAGASQGSDEVLAGVLDGVEDGIGDDQKVSVGDVISALNDRGFGALCAVIGALAATPVIGALPGVSIGAAALVLLVAGQHVVGRQSPWIPAVLAKRSFDRETFDKSVDKVRPYAKWLDRVVRPRLSWIIGGESERRIAAVAMCVLAVTMLPLALVPWGVFAPALAITALGIAITGRDGAFALAGYALTAATAYVLYTFWSVIVGLLQ